MATVKKAKAGCFFSAAAGLLRCPTNMPRLANMGMPRLAASLVFACLAVACLYLAAFPAPARRHLASLTGPTCIGPAVPRLWVTHV